MTLEVVLNNAWKTTKDNFKKKRYLHNYPNDIVAGNISRTPVYACVDNLLVGVTDGQALGSALNSLYVSIAGWSIIYAMGNSILASSLGETYQKHAKKIDAVYSATMTFILGMGVNLAAGYDLKQATIASGIRAAIAVPLGPVTRYYTDSFREARGEQYTAKKTNFHNKNWKYSAPRIAAMIALPLATMFGTLALTTDKATNDSKTIQTHINKPTIDYTKTYALNL